MSTAPNPHGGLSALADARGISSEGRERLWQEQLTEEEPLLAKLRCASERELRTAKVWDRFRAFAEVFDEGDPRRRTAEDPSGTLSGRSLGVKDNIAVAGWRNTAGTRAYHAALCETDAPVVARLRRAGCQVVGMTNMQAIAYGALGISTDLGPVINPLNSAVVPGGSSSGSAVAVAAGLVDTALGTDTGGSIRIPSAFCGLVGLKPTWGKLPFRGIIPLAQTLDHVGPMTKNVADAIAMFDAMADGKYGSGTTVSRSETVIGVPDRFFAELLHPEIRHAYEQLLNLIGRDDRYRVVSVSLPIAALTPAVQLAIMSWEAFREHGELLRSGAEQLPSDVRLRLEMGMFRTDEDYRTALTVRGRWIAELDAALMNCDAILIPTTATIAPTVEQRTVTLDGQSLRAQAAVTRLTGPFNISGHPAVTIPWAEDSNGAGIGMQLVNSRGDDRALLNLAAKLEQTQLENGGMGQV